jgi:hypothetical protein
VSYSVERPYADGVVGGELITDNAFLDEQATRLKTRPVVVIEVVTEGGVAIPLAGVPTEFHVAPIHV